MTSVFTRRVYGALAPGVRSVRLQPDPHCLVADAQACVSRHAVPAFGCGAPFVTAEKPPLRPTFSDRRRSVTCAAFTLRGGFIAFAVAVPQVRSSLECRNGTAPMRRRAGQPADLRSTPTRVA